MTSGAALSSFSRKPLGVIVEQITAAMASGTGFALIRLGDGEGQMLCAPRGDDPGGVAAVLHRQFGHEKIRREELVSIAEALRRAVRSADVVGLPTSFQFDRHVGYRKVFEAFADYGLRSPSQAFTDANVHWYLQWSGALAQILEGRESLCVITCRELESQLIGTFRLGAAHTYLVRGAHHDPGRETRPHWPDGFAALTEELKHLVPGTVFLVGVGFLGKIYCDLIKAKGGVAIDIGSLFDSWAGVASRLRYRHGSPAFTLDHFANLGPDRKDGMRCLERCIKEFDIRDATY